MPLEMPNIGSNTKKAVQCYAEVTTMGVHKSQCPNLAPKTGSLSLCHSHRRSLKFRAVTTIDGSMWTAEGFEKHRQRFKTQQKIPGDSHNPPTVEESFEIATETHGTPTFAAIEREEEHMGSHDLQEFKDDDNDPTPETTDKPLTPAQLRIREAEAIPAVMTELAELTPEAAGRVLAYVSNALGIASQVAVASPSPIGKVPGTRVKGIVSFIASRGNVTAEEIAQGMGYAQPAIDAALRGVVKMAKVNKVQRPDGVIGYEVP